MKLEQDDVTRICQRVVDHDLDTQLVADQFDISQRRVQQLAKDYRETGDVPQLQKPGRKPFADHPADLEERILDLRSRLDVGAVAIVHILRVRDGLSIANNRVHTILQEYDHVTDHPRKQGRKRPWVRWERDHALVTVHLDWYHNERGDWVLAVEDDASRMILGMIEEESRSAAKSVELLDDVVQGYASVGPILEVITDHGSEFYANKRDDRGGPTIRSRSTSPNTASNRRCVQSDDRSRTGRSSGSSRPTTSSDGGSRRWTNSSISTTKNDHT